MKSQRGIYGVILIAISLGLNFNFLTRLVRSRNHGTGLNAKSCFGDDSHNEDLMEAVIEGNEHGLSLIETGKGFAKVVRTRYVENKSFTTTAWAFFAFKEGRGGMLRWNWQQDCELHADYGLGGNRSRDSAIKKLEEAKLKGVKPVYTLQPWPRGRPGVVYRGIFNGEFFATFMDDPCEVNIFKGVSIASFKQYKSAFRKFDPFYHLTYFGQTLGEFLARVEEGNGEIDITEQDGLYIVSWKQPKSKKDRMAGNFAIDPDKAFQIVKSKSWFLTGEEQRLFNDDAWELEEHSDGIWFLKKRVAKLYDRKTGAIDEENVVEISNAKINVTVYDRIFTLESMGIPDGAMISDERFTPPRTSRYHWNRITDMEVIGIVEALRQEKEKDQKGRAR